jgi:hypothetical protein
VLFNLLAPQQGIVGDISLTAVDVRVYALSRRNKCQTAAGVCDALRVSNLYHPSPCHTKKRMECVPCHFTFN